MRRLIVFPATLVLLLALFVAGCAQSAPAPTAAPAAPTKAAEPAKAAEPTKAAAAAPTAAPTAAPAKKVDYPIKGRPITFIVPYAAGGGSDGASRVLAPFLEKELGVSVEVVNKAGASTQMGTTELARAKPDGHTIEIINIPTTLTTYLDPTKKAIYTRKDFQPIAGYIAAPVVVLGKSDGPFTDVKSVVDAAKAKPGELKVATAALLGSVHLGFLSFEKTAGIKVAYVHFDGGAPSQTALLGGHVDLTTQNADAVISNVKSGALKVLGVMDKEQAEQFPGVKTFEQQGYKVYQTTTFGLITNAGVPKDVMDVLNGAVKRAMENPDLKKRIADMGQNLKYMSPEQFGNFWAETEPVTKELLEIAAKEAAK